MMAYAQNLADSVSIIALNPKNGEIYAMTDYPEYNLNDPFRVKTMMKPGETAV